MNRFIPIFVVILSIPAFSHAQLIITEIMYDLAEGSDSGREWIEVYNAGSEPVPLTSWRLFENGTNHKITATGSESLAPGAYAVIADNAQKFALDWPAFSGQVFDSAFSLSNDGETVSVRDAALVDSDSVAFTSIAANGTGDSLQRLPGGTFDAGIPTPGVGIPAAGLQKSPSKAKSAKAAIKEMPPAATQEIVGERSVAPMAAVAAAAVPAASGLLWWLAPLALATFGSAGIATARFYKRDEWEIEEME